jgi:hypothetical protein
LSQSSGTGADRALHGRHDIGNGVITAVAQFIKTSSPLPFNR